MVEDDRADVPLRLAPAAAHPRRARRGALAAGVAVVALAASGCQASTVPGTPSVTSSRGTPTASASTATPTVLAVTASELTFAQDALVDPVVTGTVSGARGVRVDAQVFLDGAWVTQATATPGADGSYSVKLTYGNGQLRSDRWRMVAGGVASSEIAVERTAVLNPAVRAATREELTYSWREGCPVSYTALRVLQVNYYGFDGLMHRGTLVVHEGAVAQFEGLLQTALDARFPIAKMQPVDAYKAVDADSAADNNTSAFNCRMTTLGSEWSQHSKGTAIDINPVENPYSNAGLLIPPAGKPYLDRGNVRPGMLTAGSPVIKYALANGWTWLAPTDYQHLERREAGGFGVWAAADGRGR